MASGNLGNICLREIQEKFEVGSVFTDKNSRDIISLAADNSFPCFIGNPRRGEAQKFLKENSVDILLSINYLFLIEQDVLSWPSKAAVNFHGSLLPKYRGRTPHVWAIINGETMTGVTAHKMTLGCDEGEIVATKTIQIRESDTGGILLERFTEIYPELIQEVLISYKNDSVNPKPQDESRATYFGKRTPQDGLINWHWQKERIRNWVRAQADPYPGAFTFINNTKVIIDRVAYVDYGFRQSQPNGLILTEKPCMVKTPNGVLVLEEVREGKEALAKNGLFETG
ncbi:methionyl-tRNA formyltransferase [Akkermansiaceae bacterium]|nr:methionyl-tRNA formyltransferase [Akkermansiaceae bacterium]MDB4684348.1 methionyl-tRNA formyltransferase [Akkermansiaceae bacterium]